MNKVLLTAMVTVALVGLAVVAAVADDAAATPGAAAQQALALARDTLVQHGASPTADLKNAVLTSGGDDENQALMLIEFISLLNTKVAAPQVMTPETTSVTATLSVAPIKLIMTQDQGVWKLDLKATFDALPAATRTALMALAQEASGETPPPAPGAAAAGVTELTDANFTAGALQAPGYVLVDAAATWCEWCKKMAPVLAATAPQYAGQVKFVHIYMDENAQTKALLKVDAFPTLIMFKDGKEVNREVNYLDQDQLKAWIDGSLK
jgi:thioredoxin 1